MNIVTCSENCRYQQDGYCTLEELDSAAMTEPKSASEAKSDSSALCRYFVKR